MNIVFPQKVRGLNDRYWHIHNEYVLNIFRYTNCNVSLQPPLKRRQQHAVLFDVLIDNKPVIFDFSDFEQHFPDDIATGYPYFKFHYSKECEQYKNVFPFSPVNFHNWKEFYELEPKIKYTATGLVMNNQIARAGALVRRTHVQKILKEHYGKWKDQLDMKRYSQREFFLKVNSALVSVCVPGARNDMLDRGQGQYMFLGACTISPLLKTRLSYNRAIIPNEHYLLCNDDYSDLIDRIEWVRNNKDAAIQIGQNAKRLMFETSTPEKQIEWIMHNAR